MIWTKSLASEYGADDYITKPFNILEVKARIKAIMRRTSRKEMEKNPNVIEDGDVRLDCESRRLFIQGREIKLTAKEFDLMELMVKTPGKKFTAGNVCLTLSGDMSTREISARWMYMCVVCVKK